jgi:hypothetical protein
VLPHPITPSSSGWVAVNGGVDGADVIECVLDHRTKKEDLKKCEFGDTEMVEVKDKDDKCGDGERTVSLRDDDKSSDQSRDNVSGNVNVDVSVGVGEIEEITSNTEFLIKWKNWAHFHNEVCYRFLFF